MPRHHVRHPQHWINALLASAVLVCCAGAEGATQHRRSSGCLYAVTVGADKVQVVPCAQADPLNLANDPKIRAAMKALGLNPAAIRFNGCPNAWFSAAPDDEPHRYTITYPLEEKENYIAPITHELAHVLQMEMAGGLQALRQNPSRKIELGADYLTGIVFSQGLGDIKLNEFQHNLSLIGLYVEMDTNAHGTPAQRTTAFRFGAYMKFEEVGRNIRRAHERFLTDVYGRIVQ